MKKVRRAMGLSDSIVVVVTALPRCSIAVATIVVAILSAVPNVPASAQLPNTSAWTCERCPFRTGRAASYSAGVTYVSDDAAHFGDATGYDEQGGYANLDADGWLSGERQQLRWSVANLGLDSRALEIDGGRQGTYDYYAHFRALPRRELDTTRTVFADAGGDRLVLPSGWARAGSTSGLTALAASLFDRNIESDRKTIELGGGYVASDRFDVFADFRQSHQDGVKIQGGAFFTNASLLPRPFDYRTDEIDIGLRYGGARSTLELGYYASFFEDRALSLQWENPFTSVVGGEVGELARPPDSSFHQIALAGNVRTRWRDTVISYSVATGIMEQDDPLLAYTTNTALATAALPRSTLDGRVDTRNLALTATSRPFSRLRLKLAYTHNERDNETPVELWSRVIVDSFNTVELRSNVPYGFERGRLNLRGDFDWKNKVRLSAGYDYAETKRDFQEVAEQDEESGWGQIGWQPGGNVDLRARFGTAKRNVDRYDENVALRLGQNPLLRKYELAYRYREFGEITVAGSFPQKPISMSGTLRVSDDSYTQSELGLLSGDELHVGVDLAWAVAARSSVHAMVASDEIDSAQAGSELGGAADWNAAHRDEFVTLGGGFRIEGLNEKFDLDIDYTRSVGTSAINVVAASGGLGRFPDLESELDSLRVRLRYRRSERWHGALELRYERFDADDWALQDVAPATIPSVLSLGASPYEYDVVLISVSARYLL